VPGRNSGAESNTDSKRSNGASLKLKGKICSACVRSSMIYGSESETWPMKVKDKQRLERAERMMVRNIY